MGYSSSSLGMISSGMIYREAVSSYLMNLDDDPISTAARSSKSSHKQALGVVSLFMYQLLALHVPRSTAGLARLAEQKAHLLQRLRKCVFA